MSYQSKAEREAAAYMTWPEILNHVQEAKRCDQKEARRQIGEAIEERELFVRWADESKNVFGPPAEDHRGMRSTARNARPIQRNPTLCSSPLPMTASW